MSELLREIEEDIRRERTQKLWHSFGKLMVAASVGLVIITIGVVIWQDQRRSHAMEETAQFIQGLDRLKLEDYKGAQRAFGELTDDESSPYYSLAMLRLAQTKTLAGDKDGALKTYQELAKRDRSDDSQAFAELAKILAASGSKTVIEPVEDSGFYFSQSEWKAWQLFGQGKKKEAAELFAMLYRSQGVPFSMRERATMMLQNIAPEKLASVSVESKND